MYGTGTSMTGRMSRMNLASNSTQGDDTSSVCSESSSRAGIPSLDDYDDDDESEAFGRTDWVSREGGVRLVQNRPTNVAASSSLPAPVQTNVESWDRIYAASTGNRPTRPSYQASSSSNGRGNPGFANIRALGPTRDEIRDREIRAQRRNEEISASNAEDDDDDDDGPLVL